MDPQELERIAENIGRIIDQDGPESDILAYLQSEGFDSREAWLSAWDPPVTHPTGGPTIGASGPTAQPLFPTLPPMVGGALDALVAFGTGVTFGAANKIPGVREYNADLRSRNPRLTTALGGAGAAMAIPTTLAAGTAANIGVRGASLLARSPLGVGAGIAGGGLGAYYWLRRLAGN